jgi:hypothetical protein
MPYHTLLSGYVECYKNPSKAVKKVTTNDKKPILAAGNYKPKTQ